jgi:putative DNA primase/helicase
MNEPYPLPNTVNNEKNAIGAVITCLSNIQPEAVDWLWLGLIALGKLSIIMGAPSTGKTLLSLYIAARVSSGLSWPIDNNVCPKGSVLLLSNEDGIADTVRPRLDAANADVTHIHHLSMINFKSGSGIRERLFSLSHDIHELERFLQLHSECKLIIIDPITAYLGGSDGYNNSEVRGLLAPLSMLASKYNVAILCITHPSKAERVNALDRMSGSIAFGAVARSVLLVVKDKNNPKRRLVLQAKNNLAEDVRGLAFTVCEVDGSPAIEWESEYLTMSIESAFMSTPIPESNASEVHDAVEWLIRILKDGRMKSTEIFALAKDEGRSAATVRRAKKKVGVVHCKEGFDEETHWYCALPPKMIKEIEGAHDGC